MKITKNYCKYQWKIVHLVENAKKIPPKRRDFRLSVVVILPSFRAVVKRDKAAQRFKNKRGRRLNLT